MTASEARRIWDVICAGGETVISMRVIDPHMREVFAAWEKAEARVKVLEEALSSDKWFEDWWAGMDDVIYEDDECWEAVNLFRHAALAGKEEER